MKKLSNKEILRFLPKTGILIFIFIALAILLLYMGKMDRTIPAMGILEPYPKIEIKATIKDTVIESIKVKERENVETGETLIILKDQEQNLQKINQLKEKSKLFHMNLERLKRLFGKEYVAMKDVEEAELKVKILAEEIKAIYKRIDALVIKSPLTGTVVKIPVKEGDLVIMGMELAVLTNSEKAALCMWIKEDDSTKLAIGQKVRIYSHIFSYRRYGIAWGKIVEISRYPQERDGGNYFKVIAKITEIPFPITFDSTASARIIIERCKIINLFFNRDR